MANPIGAARSRLFQVKDLEAFQKEFEDVDIEINVVNADERIVWLNGDDEGFWPSDRMVDDHWVDLNLLRTIAPHLEPGQVAVLEDSSTQGPYSTQGSVMATNAEGDEYCETLSTIAGKAVLSLNGTALNMTTHADFDAKTTIERLGERLLLVHSAISSPHGNSRERSEVDLGRPLIPERTHEPDRATPC